MSSVDTHSPNTRERVKERVSVAASTRDSNPVNAIHCTITTERLVSVYTLSQKKYIPLGNHNSYPCSLSNVEGAGIPFSLRKESLLVTAAAAGRGLAGGSPAVGHPSPQ